MNACGTFGLVTERPGPFSVFFHAATEKNCGKLFIYLGVSTLKSSE